VQLDGAAPFNTKLSAGFKKIFTIRVSLLRDWVSCFIGTGTSMYQACIFSAVG
jgi:hypothetical protein